MLIETYAEYQQEANKTAHYTDVTYPHLLMGEEIGELGDAIDDYLAKFSELKPQDETCAVGDTVAINPSHTFYEDIKPLLDNVIKETGDVEWAIAEYIRVLGFPAYTNDNADTNVKVGSTLHHSSSISGLLAKAVRRHQTSFSEVLNRCARGEYPDLRDAILDNLNAIRRINQEILACFDVDIHEVYKVNILKLRDRQVRGVIDGSGDNR